MLFSCSAAHFCNKMLSCQGGKLLQVHFRGCSCFYRAAVNIMVCSHSHQQSHKGVYNLRQTLKTIRVFRLWFDCPEANWGQFSCQSFTRPHRNTKMEWETHRSAVNRQSECSWLVSHYYFLNLICNPCSLLCLIFMRCLFTGVKIIQVLFKNVLNLWNYNTFTELCWAAKLKIQ